MTVVSHGWIYRLQLSPHYWYTMLISVIITDIYHILINQYHSTNSNPSSKPCPTPSYQLRTFPETPPYPTNRTRRQSQRNHDEPQLDCVLSTQQVLARNATGVFLSRP
jgi:hypothetical protein